MCLKKSKTMSCSLNQRIDQLINIIQLVQQNMGSGCLKPPQAPNQIDLSVLDTIYEDVRHMQLPTHHTEHKNNLIYQQIRQRIAKKGQLKKLCDYLSSHRSRICQTVLHSYRITNQSKIYSFKYVAIIVVEAIFNSVPKNKVFADNNAVTALSSYRDSYNKKQGNASQKQITGDLNITKKFHTESSQNQIPNNLKNASTISYQITSYKFEGIYFNFVSTLLKEGGLIYKLTLQNLCKFCGFSDAIFSNESQVQQILKIIRYHLQTNDNLGISLKAYSLMLPRTRQIYFTQNIQMIKIIFNIWNSNTGSSTNLNLNTNNSVNTITNTSAQMQGYSKIEISQNCIKIIQIFIKKCVQSFQYEIIIQVIFKILDENNFKTARKVSILLFEVIQQLQLKNQFNKTLMIYLMAYVGFPQIKQKGSTIKMYLRQYSKQDINSYNNNSYNNNNEHQQQQNTNIYQKQWVDCYKLGNTQNFKKKYKNILNEQCKLNSLPIIYQWIIQQNIVQMIQLLTYSGTSLIYCYVLNMIYTSQKVKDKSINQLLKLINKLDNQYKIKILQIIMLQLDQSLTIDDSIRFILLNVCQNIIDKQKYINVNVNDSHIIQNINSNYCFQINQKIIQLMGKILCKLNKICIGKYLQHICQFYKSLYEQIVQGFTNSQQKILLLEQINIYYNKMPQFYKGINIAFLQVLENSIAKQNSPQGAPQSSLLFLDLLFVRIAKISQLGVRNQNLDNYIQVLRNTKDSQKLRLLQQYSKDRVSMNIDLPIQERRKLQYYNQSVSYFKRKPQRQLQQTGEKNLFFRGNSLNSNRDSVYTKGDSVFTKGDRDLEDVLDIIKFD